MNEQRLMLIADWLDAANLATAYSVREVMLDHLKRLNAIQVTRSSALMV